MAAKMDMYGKIGKYGYVYLDELNYDKSKNQTLNTIDTYLKGAGIESDLIDSDSEKAKKELQKQVLDQELNKMGLVKEDTEILNENKIDKMLVFLSKPKDKLLNNDINVYHGSPTSFEGTIKPLGINVGATKFSTPRWSAFVWDNKESAMIWAISQAIACDFKKEARVFFDNPKRKISIVNKTDLTKEEFENYLLSKKVEAYVYTGKIPISKLEMGSSSYIDEYTVSEEIPISKKQKVNLNKKFLDKYFKIENKDYTVKLSKKGDARNLLLNNILDSRRDVQRKNILKDIKDGKISKGDDISSYKDMINKGVKDDSFNLESVQLNNEILTEEKEIKTYYIVSDKNLDGKTLSPRVPDNFLTKNGFEENKTPRVCASTSIGGCLKGLSRNLKGEVLYIHSIDPSVKEKPYKPSIKEVPDSKITNEVWFKKPVKLKCTGKIKVIEDDGKEGKKYTYGDGLTAELYGWKYKWLNEERLPNNREYVYLAVDDVEVSRGYIDYPLTEQANGKYVNLTLEGLETFLEKNNISNEYSKYIKVPIDKVEIMLFDEPTEGAIIKLPFAYDIDKYKDLK